MNRAQKLVLGYAILLIVLMGVYPPWEKRLGKYSRPEGYGFIAMPPKDANRIAFDRLCLQWFLVALVAGGLYLTLNEKDGDGATPARNLAPRRSATPFLSRTLSDAAGVDSPDLCT